MAREKKNPGAGSGHMPTANAGPARGMIHKSKEGKIRQKDRKAKANGWGD